MQASHEQTFLSFSAGASDFVILVKEVVYIADSASLQVRNVPNMQTSASQVFDFSGTPVQLIRLADVFGYCSRAAESHELIDLLEQREQDHIDWLDALEHSLKDDVPFTKATDPHQCAFGRWYDKFEAKDKDLAEILAKFDAPHKQIHALAEQLLAQAQRGEQQRLAALNELEQQRDSTLKMLLTLFRQAKSRLADMDKPVTLIVAHHQHAQVGIEVDQVGEVMTFTAADYMENALSERVETFCFDGFYQAEDDLFIHFDTNVLSQYLLASAPRS